VASPEAVGIFARKTGFDGEWSLGFAPFTKDFRAGRINEWRAEE